MKKILIIVGLFFMILYLSNDEYILEDESIRFRVIANSNSVNDILMKEKVVDSVSKYLFIEKNTIEDTESNILYNLNNIENKIDKLFKNNNYDKTYNVIYGLNEFPEKKYNGKVYKKGLYKSLVIEIGEAKGNNYWCFLYPSLCINDYNNEKKHEFKFKIIDVFKNLF